MNLTPTHVGRRIQFGETHPDPCMRGHVATIDGIGPGSGLPYAEKLMPNKLYGIERTDLEHATLLHPEPAQAEATRPIVAGEFRSCLICTHGDCDVPACRVPVDCPTARPRSLAQWDGRAWCEQHRPDAPPADTDTCIDCGGHPKRLECYEHETRGGPLCRGCYEKQVAHASARAKFAEGSQWQTHTHWGCLEVVRHGPAENGVDMTCRQILPSDPTEMAFTFAEAATWTPLSAEPESLAAARAGGLGPPWAQQFGKLDPCRCEREQGDRPCPVHPRCPVCCEENCERHPDYAEMLARFDAPPPSAPVAKGAPVPAYSDLITEADYADACGFVCVGHDDTNSCPDDAEAAYVHASYRDNRDNWGCRAYCGACAARRATAPPVAKGENACPCQPGCIAADCPVHPRPAPNDCRWCDERGEVCCFCREAETPKPKRPARPHHDPFAWAENRGSGGLRVTGKPFTPRAIHAPPRFVRRLQVECDNHHPEE